MMMRLRCSAARGPHPYYLRPLTPVPRVIYMTRARAASRRVTPPRPMTTVIGRIGGLTGLTSGTGGTGFLTASPAAPVGDRRSALVTLPSVAWATASTILAGSATGSRLHIKPLTGCAGGARWLERQFRPTCPQFLVVREERRRSV